MQPTKKAIPEEAMHEEAMHEEATSSTIEKTFYTESLKKLQSCIEQFKEAKAILEKAETSRLFYSRKFNNAMNKYNRVDEELDNTMFEAVDAKNNVIDAQNKHSDYVDYYMAEYDCIMDKVEAVQKKRCRARCALSIASTALDDFDFNIKYLKLQDIVRFRKNNILKFLDLNPLFEFDMKIKKFFYEEGFNQFGL